MQIKKKAFFIFQGRRCNVELIKYPKSIEDFAEFIITDRPYTQKELTKIQTLEPVEIASKDIVEITMSYGKGEEIVFKPIKGVGKRLMRKQEQSK